MAMKSLLLAALLSASASCPLPKPAPSPSPSPKPFCPTAFCPPNSVCDEEQDKCVPLPKPSPSPGYSCVVDPATNNYPVPPADSCPSPCWDNSLGWVGITFVGKIGNRYVFDATPHSKPPYCGHAPGLKCEQFQVQGGGCQDSRGPDFWMQHASWSGWEECDKFSDNSWKCHHRPAAGQAGATTVCAVPRGEPPTSPKGRCVTVNVIVGN